MKATPIFSIICVVILGLATAGIAADKKKKREKRAPVPPTVDTEAVAVIKPYDKDANFEISRDELKAMQADYKANPSGPLKPFDLSHAGTFDDLDRMSMNNKLGAAKMAGKQ